MIRFGWALAGLVLALVACGSAPEHPAPAQDDAPPEDSELTLAPSDHPAACVGVEAPTIALPVDLFAVVDGSGSMSEATFTGVSKWYATKAAFHDFLQQAPAGMGFGLSLFPLSGAASCQVERYQEEALPISSKSEMMSGVLARFDAKTPAGQTPTGPALTAALDLATKHAEQHPDRSVVVVLASDGMPTACDPVDAAALARLVKQALHGPGHVRTLVVASHSLGGTDMTGFEAIASAGGTGHALSIDPTADFARQLSQALGAAASRGVACDVSVPEPPENQRLDYDAVNVVLEGGESRVTFPRVDGPEHCTTSGGWYYDIDPAQGAPARINMCKASCDRLSDRSGRTLHVELGCKTVVR